MRVCRSATPYLVFLALLAATVAQRAWIGWTSFTITPDNGSVGLMALHIMEGERPLFLYGFNYSGALLPYVMAGVFKACGISLVTFVGTAVLFALGWVVVTFLLFKELLGVRAGWAAALSVACPDLVTSWYSQAPDCSYTPLFFLGTTSLWLSLRIANRDAKGVALWVQALVLGCLAGLSLWTHMLSVLYLFCGAAFLLPFFVRRRFRPDVVFPFLAGAVPMLVCLVPYLFVEGEGGSVSSRWRPTVSALRLHLDLLLNDSVPCLYTWPSFPPSRWLGCFLLGALLALYAWNVFVGARRGRMLFPLAFVGLFLGFYLPHALAAEAAPRYLVAPWVILVGGAFAVVCSAGGRRLRHAGWVLLAVWISHHLAGAAISGMARRAGTEAVRKGYLATIESAGKTGAEHVMLLDEYERAAHGQTLTFLARDRIRFVAVDEERYQAAAQDADESPTVAFAGSPAVFSPFANSLRALGATWKDAPAGPLRLAHDIEFSPRGRRSVPPREMKITATGILSGRPGHLADRTKHTMLLGRDGEQSRIDIDLGRLRTMEGLLFSSTTRTPAGLPAGYRIEGSADGVSFRVLKEVVDSRPFVYGLGNRVYAGGGYGWQECRFGPAEVRYLRVVPTQASHPERIWFMSEVHALESMPNMPVVSRAERERTTRFLREQRVSFTYADRSLSAALLGDRRRVYDEPPAYPRYNEHLRMVGAKVPFGARRFRPAVGEALAVETAFATECELLLQAVYGPGLSWTRYGFGGYTVLLFTGAPQTDRWLWWNGFMPLRL